MIENVQKPVGIKPLPERRYPPVPESSELTLFSMPDNYSASRIATAVEDCDAHLLNLNLTAERGDRGELVVDLRVDRRNPDSIIRSLNRYGYDVLDVNGDESELDDSAQMRAAEILRLLEI